MLTPEGERLQTIMETAQPAYRGASSDKASPGVSQSRWSNNSGKSRVATLPRVSAEQMPPPYILHDAQQQYNISEKQGRIQRLYRRNGGWGRLCLLVALLLVLLLAIGLGVGLGVGLKRQKNASGAQSTASMPTIATKEFPLGQYSMITSLADQQINCTSNAATWSCYPYSTYPASSSLATFGWIMSNTSAMYPTNASTPVTDAAGIPANVTITAIDDPFSIEFEPQHVTYINNASDPRLAFSFTMSKNVIPTLALTASNQATSCYFNSTIFSAVLYLSSSSQSPLKEYPTSNTTELMATYTPWPYAVQVLQTSPGGTNVPACYYTNDGALGDRLTDTFTVQSTADECVCEYKNYGL